MAPATLIPHILATCHCHHCCCCNLPWLPPSSSQPAGAAPLYLHNHQVARALTHHAAHCCFTPPPMSANANSDTANTIDVAFLIDIMPCRNWQYGATAYNPLLSCHTIYRTTVSVCSLLRHTRWVTVSCTSVAIPCSADALCIGISCPIRPCACCQASHVAC